MQSRLKYVVLVVAAFCISCNGVNKPTVAEQPAPAASPASPATATAAPGTPAAPAPAASQASPSAAKVAVPVAAAATAASNGAGTRGWLAWRGPHQTGVSDEQNLPSTVEIGGKSQLWTFDIAGRGSPVIANGKLFGIGYRGERADLEEVLFCLNAETGEKQWEFASHDFLSDVVYDRYSIGSPVVDAQTGQVYYLSTPGILYCFKPDGKLVWHVSMAERYGRNTYPNGRTGAPVIDGDLVITRGVTNNWGGEGPPNDRFYALDKFTGELVWSSTPGVGPPFLKDSSVSTPFVATVGGKRVFFSGTGDGNIVCINARDGTPIWRYQYCVGGIGSSTVMHKDGLIAIHGLEQPPGSPYGSDQGAITMLKLDGKTTAPKPGEPGAPFYGQDSVVWRNKVVAFTSSPVLVGDRIFQTGDTGLLYCFNAKDGKTIWEKKLAPDQIHASPAYGDGKLYVPFNNGAFYILKIDGDKMEELCSVKFEHNALGAPALWNGKVYVHTMGKLYCFGEKRTKDESPVWPAQEPIKAGPPAKLQAIPAEVVMHPGEKQAFRVRAVDAHGHVVAPVVDFKLDYFVPPTARVKSQMDAKITEKGELVADKEAKMSAGSFKVTSGTLSGTLRGRVLPSLPYKEDFEKFQVTEAHETEKDEAGNPSKFAYPPLPWLKARFSWEIRELDGNKVLAKTLDRLILQRAQTFIQDDSLSNYTMQADVMTDGNRRLSSDVGLINQRYQIVLKGNHGELEISSNIERVNQTVKFPVVPKKWYTLKTRVDVAADGSGIVRAKAWPKGEPEPEAWTLEFNHKKAHKNGSPGLYGFGINGKFRVYIDNVAITQN